MNTAFNRKLLSVFSALAFLCLFVGAALAQQTGSIYGNAEDVNGAAVSGIKVTINSPALIGGARSLLTNTEGKFQFFLLPIGTYEVRGEAKGFKTVVQKGMQLTLGGNIEVPLFMEADAGEQVIEVKATAPMVDKQKTATGQTFSKEFLENIPMGRSYQDVAMAAPGVSDSDGDGNPTIHGGSSYSNNYFVDGINVTDPSTNTFALNFNYDAMKELQVMTGLFSPEYGNVTGGVINMVTESGSNEFTLDTSLYHTGKSLTAKDFDGNEREFSKYKGNLNVGGPIIRDRLWYYVSLEYDYNSSQLSNDSPVPELQGIKHPAQISNTFMYLAKLTWAPDDESRFDIKIQGDPATFDNADQDPSEAKSAETHQDQGGMLFGVNYNAVYDKIELKFSGGYKTQFLDIFPQKRATSSSPFGFPGVFGFGELSKKNSFGRASGCLDPKDRVDGKTGDGCTKDIQANDEFGHGQHINLDTGLISGGSSSDYYITRDRWYFKPIVGYLLQNALGDHEFQLGSEVSLMQDKERDRNPGGVKYILEGSLPDYDGDGVPDNVAYVTGSDNNELTTTNNGRSYAGFLLDNWNLYNRVYMHPGFRIENAQYDFYTGKTAMDFTTFSPRFSFSVDAFGNGRTSVHGGYARMYETGNLTMAKFVGRSIEARRVRGDANDGLAADAAPATDVNDYNYSEDPNRVRTQGGSAGTDISKDLVPMQTDEWQIGITQALGDDWVGDITYDHRSTIHAWEDSERNLIWNQAGTDVVGSRDGTGAQTFVLSKIDNSKRTYDSIETSFTRRLVDGILFNGSYTLTWYTGSSVELLTTAFDNPRQNAYSNGILPDDHRHTLKAQLAKEWDFGLNVGLNYLFESGGPYDQFYMNDYDGGYSNRRARRGYSSGDNPNDPSDDKQLRQADYTRLDLHVGYSFKELTGQDLELLCDITNLLNLQTVTSVEQNMTDTGNWGQPSNRQSPFQAELGLSYKY